MEFNEIKNGADLIAFLENWTAFNGDEYGYDINGMFSILRACLRNLNARAIDGDFEDLNEIFDTDEIKVINRLAMHLRKA